MRIAERAKVDMKWKGAILDIKEMVQAAGGFEEEAPGAAGTDMPQADEPFRRMTKRHRAMMQRLQRDARSRQN